MLPPAMRTLNFGVSMLDKARGMSVLIDAYCENQRVALWERKIYTQRQVSVGRQ